MKEQIMCRCGDPNCPVCAGQCKTAATITLVRRDDIDNTRLYFCEECANDALDSGLFYEIEQ